MHVSHGARPLCRANAAIVSPPSRSRAIIAGGLTLCSLGLQAYPRAAAADTVDAMAANELAAHASLQVCAQRAKNATGCPAAIIKFLCT
jgi:hypothetical protein